MIHRLIRFGAALSVTFCASGTLAQNALNQPAVVATAYDDMADDQSAPAADDSACACESNAGCACESSCCCEPSCGCNHGCCDGGWSLGDCLGDCCLGDPCTLKEHLTPCCSDYNYGGWVAFGYYDENERLSAQEGDGLAFLDVPDHLNLDQAWLYGEKIASADACSADWGWRADVLYGVDAQKTQAFGNDDNVWDVSLDHGFYGWAIPQAYGEVAYGDWSIKAGHFFTIIGYEVVQATGNFFYSHSYTMFNSEPFTHTGALAAYKGLGDDVTLYGGWTAGWDTGYDQALGGSNFLGGVTTPIGDSIFATYALTAGNFGLRSAGGDGYSHSIVAIADLSSDWQYVLQSDYVNTDGFTNAPGFQAEDVGINQYLFYTVNDCWKLGSRMEWWKSNTPSGTATSFYELTGGINYKPHANVVVRPEIRYNWSPTELVAASNGAEFNNTVFAIDAVVTY